jgi:GntR family transcriptional regulator, transcriptional repressor for pyruvate dehydrogenase complex
MSDAIPLPEAPPPAAVYVPIAPVRRYEEVVRQILALIASGDITPGSRLPPERDLAERLQVSRNVLREGFRVLEERGLILARQGAGRFLRELPEDDLRTGSARRDVQRDRLERASIADILEARSLLEQEIVTLACQRRSTAEAAEACRAAERLRTWDDNLRFHRLIAAATHNFMLVRLVEQQLLLLNDLDQRGRYPSRASEEVIARQRLEHEKIASAILDRDERQARQLMGDHIRSARDTILDGDILHDVLHDDS